MELLKAAKLIKLPDTLTAEAQELLEDHAMLFVEAGGTISLVEWQRLTDYSRRAIVSAQRKLRAQSAFLSGLAFQSKLGAAQVYAEVDGGQMLAKTYLESELDRHISNAHG